MRSRSGEPVKDAGWMQSSGYANASGPTADARRHCRWRAPQRRAGVTGRRGATMTERESCSQRIGPEPRDRQARRIVTIEGNASPMALDDTDQNDRSAVPSSTQSARVIERRRMLSRIVTRIAPLEATAAEAGWQLAKTGGKQQVTTLREARAKLDAALSDEETWRTLNRWSQEDPSEDPALDRAIVLMERRYADRRVDADLRKEIAAHETDLRRRYAVFRGKIDGKKTSQGEIDRILVESNDVKHRQKAWRASKQVGREVHETIIELVQLRNRIAVAKGYRDFYAMRLDQQELSEEELFSTLTRLEKATRAPYRTRKAVLDGELARRFEITADDLQPWHYADPFFQRIRASGGLKPDDYYAERDLSELAIRFFDGLGMDVRDVLERSDLFPRAGKEQHAFCTHIDRKGDIRILANVTPGERWMTTLLHELGHAVYERYNEQPWELATPAHMSTTEAVAMLMGRQATDIEYLIEYADVPAFDVTPLSGELRRHQCFRMQMFMRWALVVVHFERELYADPVRDDLNALWWELKRKYQLIEPPDGRTEPDWAAKLHLALVPVYYQNYVIGELVASQLRSAICEEARIGSLVDSQYAGEFLIEQVFRHGASKRWDQLLVDATGEALNPQHFIREFTG